QALITRLSAILSSEKLLLDVIKEELREVKNLFADPRRTEIQGEASELSDEDLIAEEDMVVTISHQGYVKRNPVSLYRAQRRGGRGKAGAGTTDDDFIEQIFVASTHDYVLIFTSKGRVFWLKVHELPQAGRAARAQGALHRGERRARRGDARKRRRGRDHRHRPGHGNPLRPEGGPPDGTRGLRRERDHLGDGRQGGGGRAGQARRDALHDDGE